MKRVIFLLLLCLMLLGCAREEPMQTLSTTVPATVQTVSAEPTTVPTASVTEAPIPTTQPTVPTAEETEPPMWLN